MSCVQCDLTLFSRKKQKLHFSDICLVDNGGCDFRRRCTNTNGDIKCGDCPSGFSNYGDNDCAGQCWSISESDAHLACVDIGKPHINCSDVNECLNNNGGCDSKRLCFNRLGSRVCGDCPSGYSNAGDAGCEGSCWPAIFQSEFR